MAGTRGHHWAGGLDDVVNRQAYAKLSPGRSARPLCGRTMCRAGKFMEPGPSST